MSRKRIILIEDEKDMAELVAMRLRKEHYDVELAHNGPEGLEKIRSNPPDLALLDIMLPGMSGTEIAAEMKKDPRTAGVPIIMLTAKSEESDIVVGLHIGADDYVTKPFNMSVLLARIAAVLRRSDGSAGPQSGVLTAGSVRVNLDTHTVEVNSQPVALTLTEFRILAAVIAARGRVLTRNQLIDKALGQDAVVTDRTIDVHVTALRRKLASARNCIETVRGIGYRLANDDDETH